MTAAGAGEGFVFGYGSLAEPVAGGHRAVLTGAHRGWTVAMDNTIDLPGYKYYLDVEGLRPAVCVAFLDLVDEPAVSVEGFCRPVGAADLEALDRRERQYDRIDVTDRMTPAPGRTWTYVGKAESRERAARARREARLVVARGYLDVVPRDVVPDVPVLDLLRVDLP